MNSSEESSSSRIEKLAALGAAESEARYGDGLKAWLAEFVTAELPGTPAPPLGSWEEAAAAVDHLARNKRAWSQRLGSIVIELNDDQTPESGEEASAKLRDFIQLCPWKYLRDSASRKL